MLLESELRILIILFPIMASFLLLTSCDRAIDQKEQVPETKLGTEKIATPIENGALESASGLKAQLLYDNAGSEAPKVEFFSPDGSKNNLTNYRGRPLLLNLWATWCGPCRVEMPSLDTLAALEEGKLTVLTVSQDLEGGKVVRPFFEKYQFANLQGHYDPQNNLWKAVGASALPVTILYDENGIEKWRVVGGLEWDDEMVADLIHQ
ncbi:hypothetical protein LPB140_04015 [Sphingorhabdus lutea]|uniref:Thioredoxin domain-containing protein n=1 Tax=Sphingorhabdus lutea TaxID=1913578 RepID=A0A1L3JAF9_9SPHN|nr:TlpA disulfide reductase family protein [Sphingorhabdus lutea]APG62112.1 hypothetical protein LPB140_04015 [Sphingorhabdus lutea]